MARTSKKAKPVPVETVEAVADTEIRSADNIAAKIVAAVPETGAEGVGYVPKATAPVDADSERRDDLRPAQQAQAGTPENARKTPAQRGVHRAQGGEHCRQGNPAKPDRGART
jgi:type IV secretory pathway TrbL component